MGKGMFYLGSAAGIMIGLVAGTLISNKLYGVPKIDVQVPEQAAATVKNSL